MAVTPKETAVSNISTYLDMLPINYPNILQLPQIDRYVLFITLPALIWLFWPNICLLVKKNILNINWGDDPFLNISSQRHSKGTSEDIMLYGDIIHRISGFYIKGENNSRKPINNISGYIQSDKTNFVLPILLDGMQPEETYGIPPKCEFYVSAIFPRSTPELEGYTLEDFWRHMGAFTFVFKYDDKEYRKKYSQKQIKSVIEKRIEYANKGLNFKDKPRVKKKATNK